jgi:hypothetical protein
MGDPGEVLRERVDAGLARVDEAGNECGPAGGWERMMGELAAAEATREAARAEEAVHTSAVLASLDVRLAAAREKLVVLPCFQFDPENGVGDIHRATDACEAAGAWRGCWRAEQIADRCPRLNERRPLLEVERRLTAAGVPGDAAGVLLAELPGRRDANGQRMPVAPPYPPGQAKRSRAREVVRSMMRGELHEGHEVRTLVLAGATGRGKDVAAAWAVLRRPRALWVKASRMERPDDALDALMLEVELLVIEDAGREHVGANGYAPTRIANAICDRHDEHPRSPRWTIVTTNQRRRRVPPERGEDDMGPQFLERYGSRVDSRIEGAGRFLELVGEPNYRVQRGAQ